MGVLSEKATNAAITVADELEYVARVLQQNLQDIYTSGRAALNRCRKLLAKISTLEEEEEDKSSHQDEEEESSHV